MYIFVHVYNHFMVFFLLSIWKMKGITFGLFVDVVVHDKRKSQRVCSDGLLHFGRLVRVVVGHGGSSSAGTAASGSGDCETVLDHGRRNLLLLRLLNNRSVFFLLQQD
mmetsp:Transcript_28935/g.60509  ORF Transcript_28935/g.60509 Transcript_28935/m.60509 type:complete len:108 (-) Transcript_28935:1927-2250(-)